MRFQFKILLDDVASIPGCRHALLLSFLFNHVDNGRLDPGRERLLGLKSKIGLMVVGVTAADESVCHENLRGIKSLTESSRLNIDRTLTPKIGAKFFLGDCAFRPNVDSNRQSWSGRFISVDNEIKVSGMHPGFTPPLFNHDVADLIAGDF